MRRTRRVVRAVAWRGLGICCAVVVVAAALAGCSVEIGQPQVVSAKNAITVPVQVQHVAGGGVNVLVDVMINGHGPFTFVVDTGAESSLVDKATAEQLQLRVDGSAHEIGGIGGSEVAVPVAITRWQMGKVRLPPMDVDSASVQNLAGDGTVGLLGSDVLSQFGNITINYDLRTLTVYKQIA
ncbi:MAG: retropepsin-like aspartic protease [Ktedonobacterales bacterium]